MRPAEQVHAVYVGGRRVRVLVEHLSELVPPDASLLDVGCGDGRIAAELMRRRPDVDARGIDVLVRPDAAIPVQEFDGEHIPLADDAVDVVLLVDVLHHTASPRALLQEAGRVARRCVLLKDHNLDGLFAGPTLRFMDRVGNERHEVALPFNYWPARRWREAWQELGFSVGCLRARLGLYPWPASWLFERGLHFIARLDVPGGAA